MTDSNLVFRRQFLIAPEACAAFPSWQHLYAGGYYFYAHPDLELCTITSTDGHVVATLLGYIIDPHHPGQSNADILNRLANLAGVVDKIADYLNTLSGRFVLVVKTPDETLMFNDPCGLRTAFYMQNEGRLYIGSQPLLFKKILPLQEGGRLQSYMSSAYVKGEKEHWIPAGLSLFESVSQLVPNHYLQFSALRQTRYWPKQALPKKPIDASVAEAAALLEKLMVAGNNRFCMALPVTAGWDSRIILSATKKIAVNVYFYTLQYRNLKRYSSDINIPAKIFRSQGLQHHLIDCRKVVPDVFHDIYQGNTSPAHMHDWGEIAYGMSAEYPQDRVCLKGNCSEIVRCFYYKSGTHEPVKSADQILALEPGWHAMPFLLGAPDGQLAGTKPAGVGYCSGSIYTV